MGQTLRFGKKSLATVMRGVRRRFIEAWNHGEWEMTGVSGHGGASTTPG